MKADYEKQIAELKERKAPPITEAERQEYIRRRDAALAANEAVMPTTPPAPTWGAKEQADPRAGW